MEVVKKARAFLSSKGVPHSRLREGELVPYALGLGLQLNEEEYTSYRDVMGSLLRNRP